MNTGKAWGSTAMAEHRSWGLIGSLCPRGCSWKSKRIFSPSAPMSCLHLVFLLPSQKLHKDQAFPKIFLLPAVSLAPGTMRGK